jgi:hypothetical protein
MKRCLYCSQQVPDEAIKCDHRGRAIEQGQQVKWYFKTCALVVAFLCVGHLALPLVWLNPRFSQKTKIIVSLLIAILSWYLGVLLVDSFKSISKFYQQLNF